MLSSNWIILLNNIRRREGWHFLRLCSNSSSSSPFGDDDGVVIDTNDDIDKNNSKLQQPRVKRLFFKSGLIEAKNRGGASGGVLRGRSYSNGDQKPPSIVRVPMYSMHEHIFPHFSKLVKINDTLATIMSVTPPKSKRIGIFAKSHTGNNELYEIGTLASFEIWPHLPSNSAYVLLNSHHRLKRLKSYENKSNSLMFAECEVLYDPHVDVTSEIRILCNQIIDFVRRLQPFFPYNSSAREELNTRILNPLYWSYVASDFTMPSETSKLQVILEENDVLERLKKTLQTLHEEFQFFEISSQMTQKLKDIEVRESYIYNLNRLKQLVDNTIYHYTNSQTPVNSSSKQSNEEGAGTTRPFGRSNYGRIESPFEKKIRERLKHLTLPEQVRLVIEDELVKISNIDRSSVEYGIVQTYLENLSLVPWGVCRGSGETHLKSASDILNQDHYGLEEIKETILEHMAVSSRMEKSRGRILCFVGPPGVGKTSIVKSIARALNRDYARISVGGIDDSCEIKGHRRTYIGAMPGKIVKALQASRSMDPVFCVDEIDKLCRTHRGDPSGSLLEAFDPEQNSQFVDHFLDVPCDLSRVLFICTANSTSTISTPLLDRMEVIPISGYTSEEKMNILLNYIIPNIVQSFDIGSIYESRLKIDREVLQKLTDEYFLEAGVRQLKNCVEKIFRKGLKELDMDQKENIHVMLDNITQYAGYPQHLIRKKSENESVFGLVTGLSFVEGYGTGFTLEIECDLADSIKDKGQIVATGLAGQSLCESSNVAFLMAKKVVSQLYPDNKQLDQYAVRIHFLEGGVKKDGPSAGVAIFSAILSQALSLPVSRNIAMTGEITLKGNIISVGGIKEKVAAALRTGITNIILPLENQHNFLQINDAIKSKVNVCFVSNVVELLKIVFPSLQTQSLILNDNQTISNN